MLYLVGDSMLNNYACLLQQQRGAPVQRPKQPPMRSLEPLTEKVRNIRDGNVKLATMFNSVDLQGDYNGYTMVYDGRKFRKLIPGVREEQEPSKIELVRFVLDLVSAAHKDPKVLQFIQSHPIRLAQDVRQSLGLSP